MPAFDVERLGVSTQLERDIAKRWMGVLSPSFVAQEYRLEYLEAFFGRIAFGPETTDRGQTKEPAHCTSIHCVSSLGNRLLELRADFCNHTCLKLLFHTIR